MKSMTLEKMLQSQGFGSRKQCAQLIREGRVRVGERLATDPSTPFFSNETPNFQVDDQVWPYRPQAYLLLHKPAHVECSHAPQHHPSVFSLLPAPLVLRGVECVGRLDEDTTGLLLLSDNGQFIHGLSSPKRKVSKTYLATLRYPINPEFLEKLWQGVLLHGETECLKADACLAEDDFCLRFTISQGKYHQVKRMVAAAGNRVEALHRCAMGQLQLSEDLLPGQWRWLESSDFSLLGLAPGDFGFV
ncbi:pseudouridine synthase [Azospira inquinata]|nr:16S rRNA pseudouridine(516) synthase [Azospira inquinata]QWT47034.1 16S rRNA pseudouridine(516) synthase [Azospira inquinata]